MLIVIARYNENIDWSIQFPNVLIYNKGELIKNCDNQILLENVGTICHTYYKYIYDNYDNLENYTIFLKGNPFIDSPDALLNIWNYINDKNLDINFNYISEKIINCNLSGCYYDMSLPLIDVYEKLFNERKTNMPFIFGIGSQFIVSREQIHKRPKEFYLKIINLLNYSECPIEAFVIERFHKLIFS
jgi:hypothetical protein